MVGGNLDTAWQQPAANSANSLSPRLTSSDLLKKIILSSTLCAWSTYQVEKFEVTNII